MSLRLVLDENVENEFVDRLNGAGHDAMHVDQVDVLGKGTGDAAIAAFSRETDRIVLTYDSDFVLEDIRTRGVLYVPDESLPTATVTEIVGEIARLWSQDDIEGIVHAGTGWLEGRR